MIGGEAARAAALALALCAGEAWAHAALVETAPADGARLEAPPAEVVLRFNEPVTPIAVRLLDASGAPVALRTAPTAQGNEVQITVPPGLRTGQYLLSFRVTSLDSHPVGGSVAFSIGTETSAPGPRVAALGESAPEWPRVVTRALHYLALFTAAGGALFLLLVAPFPGQRAILAGAAALTALTATVGAGLQGAALVGAGAGLFDIDAWHAGLASSRGRSAIVAALGASAIVGGAVAKGRPLRSGLLVVGAVLAVGSLLLTGHVATAQPRALAATALAAHVFPAAFWAGSLLALFATLRAGPSAGASVALRRFSRIAIVAVLVLALGALAFATIQLGALEDLVDTAYGRLILLKSVLLTGLVALAALNRLRLVPALEHGSPRAAGRLRRSIAGEIALIACVGGVTAVLAQTPPPRTPAASIVRTLHAGDRSLELSVAPARAGRNTIRATFREAGAGRPEPAEVTLEILNPGAGVEPIVRRAERLAPGEYRHEGGELAFPGAWTVEVHARIGEFDQLVFRTELAIR